MDFIHSSSTSHGHQAFRMRLMPGPRAAPRKEKLRSGSSN